MAGLSGERIWVVALTGVVLAAAAVLGVGYLLQPDESEVETAPHERAGGRSLSFEATPGTYPTVAEGTFRGVRWELTGKAVHHRDYDSVRLELTVTGNGETSTGELRVDPGDDYLMSEHVELEEILTDADAVFGANVPGVHSVLVDVADGNDTHLSARRFFDYDSRSTITADYFVAFVPGGSPGFVHAADELGVYLDSEGYGRISRAPHVIAGGRVGDASWGLEFGAVRKERACLVFTSPGQVGSECFSRDEILAADPFLMARFEREDVLGIVAVISGEVGEVRLARRGEEPVTLSWFQPPNEDLDRWPIRLVAVGLEPGTHGALQAFDGSGEAILEEERL